MINLSVEIEQKKCQLLNLLRKYSYQNKEVVLASGQRSNVYIDCKQTVFLGEGSLLIGDIFWAMLKALKANKYDYDACGGMALGAVPLALSLSMKASMRGEKLPSLIVRKSAKGHGTKSSVEGAKCVVAGSSVLLVEDVITTGGSTILAANALRQANYNVDTVLSLVDRGAGGKENLERQGLRLYSLFSLKDFVC